jgi:hypothetical protein
LDVMAILPITPTTVEDVAAAIAAIQSLDLTAASIDDLKSRLTPIFKGHRLTAPIFQPGLKLYRGREVGAIKRTSLDALGLPPSRLVTRDQRCNRAGQSMFYCSSAMSAPFFELHAEVGQHLVISTWETTDSLTVNHIGYVPHTFEQLKSNRACPTWGGERTEAAERDPSNRMRSEFLSQIFTRDVRFGEERLYKLSIAVSEKMIGSDLFGGLIYPTIAMRANVDNVALKPTFVARALRFLKVKYVRVTAKRDLQYDLDLLDSASAIGTDGTIIWRGRPGQWVIQPWQGLRFSVEDGAWIARDASGRIVDAE